ncbi:MAG TPA: hypothetical protein VI756_17950 [Blastocatellia bacterium]
MNTLSKTLCGGVLAVAMLFAAGMSANAAGGTGSAAGANAAQVSVRIGPGYYHHHHYWYYRHHHRYYHWR